MLVRPSSPPKSLLQGLANDVLVRPRPARDVHVALESGQARVHVGGVRDLTHLTVVDDVNARLDLLADAVGHRGPHPLLQGSVIDGFAVANTF